MSETPDELQHKRATEKASHGAQRGTRGIHQDSEPAGNSVKNSVKKDCQKTVKVTPLFAGASNLQDGKRGPESRGTYLREKGKGRNR